MSNPSKVWCATCEEYQWSAEGGRDGVQCLACGNYPHVKGEKPKREDKPDTCPETADLFEAP